MLNIKIHSRSEAESLSDKEKENSSMISIQSPDNGVADLNEEDFEGRRLLRLYFDDTDGKTRNAACFDGGHVNKVLGFVDKFVPVEDDDHTLHVHCLAGQSRSAGVAMALAEILSDGEWKPTDRWQNYNSYVYQMLVEHAVRRGKYNPFS